MSDKYRLGFIILHFKVVDETIACIESILKFIDTENYQIVVVDNNSNDGSGEALFQRYSVNKKIEIVICKENNGFTGGNNIGYHIAKIKYHCDFICMMNNDTEIIQKDFFATILEEYERSEFAVLGPEIHLLDNSVCVYPKKILKLSEIEEDRKRVKKLLVKNKLLVESVDLSIKHFVMKLIGWENIRHKYREETKVEDRQEMVRIHGCCMIFSPVYVKCFDGLENRTFFYGEEDILFVQLVRNNMLSVYQPKVKIKHHEQAATSELTGKNYKKRRFTYETHLNTLQMLESMYKEDIESLKEYI